MKTWRLARIPEDVRRGLEERLGLHAARKWKRQCRRIAVKVRGVYAYVDSFPLRRRYPPRATMEQRAQIDALPTHLCRLEYLGSPDEWGFAFYKYSDEKYEVAILRSGSFTGTPEECFDCAANVYLGNVW